MVALALLPMFGFSALVIDIGMLQVERTQLQNALDASALAGVGYDVEQSHFVSSWDPEFANALYVESELTGIGTIFASVAFGVDFLSVQRSSIARAGTYYPAGESPCFLPFAIPECFLDDVDAELMALRMSSANIDNTGWADPSAEVTDTSVISQLGGQCDGEPAVTGEPVYLQNGQMTSAYQVIREMLDGSSDGWDTVKWGPLPPQMGSEGDPDVIEGEKYSVSTVTNYGGVIQGPIIIFEPGGGVCGESTQFNQTAPITGFAWAVVYDVDDTGSEKNIRVHLDLTYDYEYGTGPGGADGANVIWQDDHQLVY